MIRGLREPGFWSAGYGSADPASANGLRVPLSMFLVRRISLILSSRS